MSTISNLLKNTKISQVPKSKVKLNSKQFRVKYFPTHQIIETKPATLDRQEWGLKNNIPSKVKSKYLILDELDTVERMTQFEPIGGSQWTRLRFQEMGVVPQLQQGRRNPLFKSENIVNDQGTSASNNIIGDDQLRELCNELGVNENTKRSVLRKKLTMIKKNRGDFKDWVLNKDPEAVLNKKFNADELKTVGKKFLNDKINSSSHGATNVKNQSRFIGSGGLSYQLKGRLNNSPNGVVQKNIVPGRITSHGKQETNTAAIGGFVAHASGYENKRNNYNKGDFIRESVYPFRIEHVSVGNNGRIQIKANGNIQMNSGSGNSDLEFDHHLRGRRGSYGYGYGKGRMQQQQQQQQQQQRNQEGTANIQDVNEKASDLVERLRNMSITN